jgi:hypothetical protein
VEKTLAPEDTIQKSYRVRYDLFEGFLVLSKTRLLFMREQGFFRPRYTVTLEIPYKNIDSCTIESYRQVRILETKGTTHRFTTFGAVTAPLVKQNLDDLMAAVPKEL